MDITNSLNLSSCTPVPIAHGGYGDVYRAEMNNRTPVAIKIRRFHVNTSEEGQKSLRHAAKEIHTWSKCDHLNVLPLLGLAKFRDQIVMVSPWVDNGDLPTYLSQHRNVDRCQMSTKVAEGLVYLHDHNIIHGDLKGANVLVSSNGVPMLADFGNAVSLESSLQFTGGTTQPGFSARWTAPELLKGPSIPTVEADVYALGMTILEAITGRVPYPTKSDNAVILSAATRKLPERPEDFIPSKSRLGNLLWLMLRKCWAFEPKARPSATEVFQFMKGVTRDGLAYGSGPPQYTSSGCIIT